MDLFIKDQRSLVYLQSSRGVRGKPGFRVGWRTAGCGFCVCVCVCMWGGGEGCTAGGVQFLLGARQ